MANVLRTINWFRRNISFHFSCIANSTKANSWWAVSTEHVSVLYASLNGHWAPKIFKDSRNGFTLESNACHIANSSIEFRFFLSPMQLQMATSRLWGYAFSGTYPHWPKNIGIVHAKCSCANILALIDSNQIWWIFDKLKPINKFN